MAVSTHLPESPASLSSLNSTLNGVGTQNHPDKQVRNRGSYGNLASTPDRYHPQRRSFSLGQLFSSSSPNLSRPSSSPSPSVQSTVELQSESPFQQQNSHLYQQQSFSFASNIRHSSYGEGYRQHQTQNSLDSTKTKLRYVSAPSALTLLPSAHAPPSSSNHRSNIALALAEDSKPKLTLKAKLKKTFSFNFRKNKNTESSPPVSAKTGAPTSKIQSEKVSPLRHQLSSRASSPNLSPLRQQLVSNSVVTLPTNFSASNNDNTDTKSLHSRSSITKLRRRSKTFSTIFSSSNSDNQFNSGYSKTLHELENKQFDIPNRKSIYQPSVSMGSVIQPFEDNNHNQDKNNNITIPDDGFLSLTSINSPLDELNLVSSAPTLDSSDLPVHSHSTDNTSSSYLVSQSSTPIPTINIEIVDDQCISGGPSDEEEQVTSGETIFPKDLENLGAQTIRVSLERAKSLERRRSVKKPKTKSSLGSVITAKGSNESLTDRLCLISPSLSTEDNNPSQEDFTVPSPEEVHITPSEFNGPINSNNDINGYQKSLEGQSPNSPAQSHRGILKNSPRHRIRSPELEDDNENMAIRLPEPFSLNTTRNNIDYYQFPEDFSYTPQQYPNLSTPVVLSLSPSLSLLPSSNCLSPSSHSASNSINHQFNRHSNPVNDFNPSTGLYHHTPQSSSLSNLPQHMPQKQSQKRYHSHNRSRSRISNTIDDVSLIGPDGCIGSSAAAIPEFVTDGSNLSHQNSSLNIRSPSESPSPTPTLMFSSAAKIPPSVSFSSRIIIYDTYDKSSYDRSSDLSTCNYL
ncbi:hypothetical protein NADFUDRAFT_81589, partial [Nadsonia fulvescens var. elongata DSM 6958]